MTENGKKMQRRIMMPGIEVVAFYPKAYRKKQQYSDFHLDIRTDKQLMLRVYLTNFVWRRKLNST